MGKFHDLMDREIRIRGFSENTRLLYLRSMRCFVRHFRLPPDQLGAEHVKQYQLHLAEERRVASATLNVYVAAIRFFYHHVLVVDWRVEDIPYQRKRRRLPVVLAREEVAALLAAVPNVKHLAILMTLYAAGLRVSEAVHLRVPDVDGRRMVIRIDQGKGNKDRYVMLSERLLHTLRRYWLESRPETWLFPGQDLTRPLSRDAVGRFLARAVDRAGIQRRVTPHTLRHCFATHLLEAGVNIRVIQRLLGHRSLRSTEVYTHVATNYVRDTRSPLDGLLPAVEVPQLQPV